MASKISQRLENYPSQRVTPFLLGLSGIFSIITWLFMREVTKTNISEFNILSLEFAWSTKQMNVILNTWGSEIIQAELNGVLIDFGFLIGYSVFLSSITLLMSRKFLPNRLQRFGFNLVLLPPLAALFDAIENVNLLLILMSPTNYPNISPFIASLFALLKFALIIIVILFNIVIIVWYIGIKVLNK